MSSSEDIQESLYGGLNSAGTQLNPQHLHHYHHQWQDLLTYTWWSYKNKFWDFLTSSYFLCKKEKKNQRTSMDNYQKQFLEEYK